MWLDIWSKWNFQNIYTFTLMLDNAKAGKVSKHIVNNPSVIFYSGCSMSRDL